jgi:hypothetical protein
MSLLFHSLGVFLLLLVYVGQGIEDGADLTWRSSPEVVGVASVSDPNGPEVDEGESFSFSENTPVAVSSVVVVPSVSFSAFDTFFGSAPRAS